jgi:hypothetical protein
LKQSEPTRAKASAVKPVPAAKFVVLIFSYKGTPVSHFELETPPARPSTMNQVFNEVSSQMLPSDKSDLDLTRPMRGWKGSRVPSSGKPNTFSFNNDTALFVYFESNLENVNAIVLYKKEEETTQTTKVCFFHPF